MKIAKDARPGNGFWGIHGGRTGDAHTLFMQHSVVGLGWTRVDDLSGLPKSRDAFRLAVAKAYPDKKPLSVANNAGQLFRFVHEMQDNDIIVYPSKADRQVHLGRVVGPYIYRTAPEPGYPHQRKVEWLKQVPRTHFSQAALYELGSAISFFRVKGAVGEAKAALDGTVPLPTPDHDEDGDGPTVEQIQESTRDYVLKQLTKELKGHPLAAFVAHLLGTMGYQTRVSPEGPDEGVDIVAHRDKLGFDPPIIKVQVKSSEGTIEDPLVSAFYGKVSSGEHGLLVALGGFTPQARRFARSKSNLRLIDGSELVDLVLEHYEQFDSVYKGLLPLRRIYVPERLEEAEP